MKYTIYKITNKLNNKVYIGKHQTKNPYDNYMGSGRAIKEAIKQYGKENFKKEVLFIFDTAEEMDAEERKIVNESFISTNKTYNMGLGGEGGPMFSGLKHSEETRKKLADIQRGKKHSEETRKKISEAGFGRQFSEETRKKLADIQKGKMHSEETRKKLADIQRGKNHSDETRKKISEAAKNRRKKI
jgi:group I intron endonuclease